MTTCVKNVSAWCRVSFWQFWSYCHGILHEKGGNPSDASTSRSTPELMLTIQSILILLSVLFWQNFLSHFIFPQDLAVFVTGFKKERSDINHQSQYWRIIGWFAGLYLFYIIPCHIILPVTCIQICQCKLCIILTQRTCLANGTESCFILQQNTDASCRYFMMSTFPLSLFSLH